MMQDREGDDGMMATTGRSFEQQCMGNEFDDDGDDQNRLIPEKAPTTSDPELQVVSILEGDGSVKTGGSNTNNTDDESTPTEDSADGQQRQWYYTIWGKPLLPDDCFSIRGVKILDGPAIVKLLKFVCFTILGICLMFQFIRWANWENDEYLELEYIFVYEFNYIMMDTLFFFVVGRLNEKRGVDQLAWLGWAFLANVYSSYGATFEFMQHSFTLYEMHCRWPPGLWIFVFVALMLVGALVFLHVRYAIRNGVLVQKIVEVAICLSLLLVPYMTSPYVHLHHWFVGWLVGMHCNFDVWWSQAVMAFCWGFYINGIAVYGRDPVLTCGYALYVSATQSCPFLGCYIDAIYSNETDTNSTIWEPMEPPDWRNCSAEQYTP